MYWKNSPLWRGDYWKLLRQDCFKWEREWWCLHVCASLCTSQGQAWARLLMTPPWMSKSAAFASSHRCYYSFTRKRRANSCCSSPSNTHTHRETWWGRLKTVKMSVCKLWRWTLMGTAAVELMRHIWEDRAERRQQIWEGAMRNRYKWAERRQKEGGSMFDLTFNKPLPSVSLDVPLLCSGIWLKQ